tara:strand:- start:31490 stop:31948 length:459 start_codon:yes stop_codon:yes gene_type:complete
MSLDTEHPLPEGYESLQTGLGYTDTLQPCFRRIVGSEVSFGLWVDKQHSNSMGICHGGVLMTLADITAATGVNVARGVHAGTPTINLSVDFIASARQGDWIEARVESVSVRRRFGFCSGNIVCGDKRIARFNGTFYIPDHDGLKATWAQPPG